MNLPEIYQNFKKTLRGKFYSALQGWDNNEMEIYYPEWYRSTLLKAFNERYNSKRYRNEVKKHFKEITP